MLFDVISDSFFSPLASPKKAIYWECITKLFAITSSQLSFGVRRDVIVDELQYYFESPMAPHILEDDDVQRASSNMSSRDEANLMLRKLEGWGWIQIETDHSYVQWVNFRDYAIRIIKTLTGIAEEQRTEYQGYIYTIYTLAKYGKENPGTALLQIVEATDALITGLKSLSANMKKYLDDLNKHVNAKDVMHTLMTDYDINVVDKAYHRLITVDNVSKFRPEILEHLEANSHDDFYIEKAAVEISEIQEIDMEEAKERVLTMLHDVIDAFRRMNAILDEIVQKNTRYHTAAVNRVQFLITSSDDVRGQLRDILSYLGEQATRENLDYNGIYSLEEIDRLIRIFSVKYLDKNSLRSPIEGGKEFEPTPMEMPEPDYEVRKEKRRKLEEKMAKILNQDRIGAYVDEMLGDRQMMLASELPLQEEDTFVRIIYIRLYGRRRKMHYTLELKGMVEKDGFRFRDFLIRRKEGER